MLALQCPDGLVYDPCGDGCPATCIDRDGPSNCPVDNCQEMCRCPDGQVLDGNQCVTVDQCGCVLTNGQYLRVCLFYLMNFIPNKCYNSENALTRNIHCTFEY